MNKIIKQTYPVLEYDASIFINPKVSNTFDRFFSRINNDIKARTETTPAILEFWNDPVNESKDKDVTPAPIRKT